MKQICFINYFLLFNNYFSFLDRADIFKNMNYVPTDQVCIMNHRFCIRCTDSLRLNDSDSDRRSIEKEKFRNLDENQTVRICKLR